MEKKILRNSRLRHIVVLLLMMASKVHAQHVFDVVVYGGTAGGITSAIQVAKSGKTVAILEPGGHLGGMSVEGLGGSDIDNHREFQNSPAVGGLSLEFYKRIAKVYGKKEALENALKNRIKEPSLWRFESHVAEKVFNQWVAEHNIKVFLNQQLSERENAVLKKGTMITEIRTGKGVSFKAAVFIDATIEGDLLAGAGVSTVVGREANDLYGETLNGIRAETDHAQFSVKVDPYKIPGDKESGVIPTIQDEPLGRPGAGDKRLQAFCFRVCLTKKADNQIPFYLPGNYRRSDYEIYLRYIKAGGKLYRPGASLPNGKTDLGAWHDLSHNLYGMNMAYPEGSYAVRKKVLEQHKTFTQGLFYFLGNDPEVGRLDPDLQKEWKAWGYAKDEFTDNRGFPRMFYVRDARRMVSDYVITEHHVRKQNPTPVEDPVAMAFWPTDVHSVRRIVKDGYAYNEGFVFGGDYWRPLPVSYRSLVPKASECTNLLTPTCPSSSHIAYGAIRLEWTFMALGEACGVAAAEAVRQKSTVQQVPYSTLKTILLGNGAVISL